MTSDPASYFGYGTLLGTAAMREYCPTATPVAVAAYPGHALEFRRYSREIDLCGCHIREAPGEPLYGVVYELSGEDMESLDDASGVPRGWIRRIPVTVTSLSGEQLRTTTYVLTAPGEPLVPDDDYLGLVRTGARDAGLPAAYVERLLHYLDGLGA